MKKNAIFVSAMALVCLTGCLGKHKTFRTEGEVVKISGTMPTLLQSGPGLLSNESVKLGYATLVYQVKDDTGLSTIEVIEGNRISRANLMSRICIGTKITYTVELSKPGDEKTNPNYHAGTNFSDDILVPEPCVK